MQKFTYVQKFKTEYCSRTMHYLFKINAILPIICYQLLPLMQFLQKCNMLYYVLHTYGHMVMLSWQDVRYCFGSPQL